jgi:hypothetical protein
MKQREDALHLIALLSFFGLRKHNNENIGRIDPSHAWKTRPRLPKQERTPIIGSKSIAAAG